jgi:L,D-peptidoglycan transpeptidase YkuD (ErfK/YbiS/YcfS/YnhG family)
MSVGRVLSSCAAALAVAGCAVVAIGMSRAASQPAADRSAAPVVTHTSRPAYLPPTPLAKTALPTVAVSRPSARPAATTRAVTSRSVTPPTQTHRVISAPAPHPTTASAARTTASAVRPSPTPKPATVTQGHALPLRYSTGTATRVITVVARSTYSTTATLQAWTKAPGGGWLKYGAAVTAHVGADGLSTSPSEYRSATPIGSFTLTHAFGHNSDPGTALPYLHTNANDWWISQSGPLYNTHQRCSSGCAFTRGAPNEHLYYETPYYNYAAVIDYNTRNSPTGVRQGAGSAFFLHVTDGAATAGCVAIGQSKLVSLLRWLTPTAHPRILIGVS